MRFIKPVKSTRFNASLYDNEGCTNYNNCNNCECGTNGGGGIPGGNATAIASLATIAGGVVVATLTNDK